MNKTNINVDLINIRYHTENLDTFFSMYYPHFKNFKNKKEDNLMSQSENIFSFFSFFNNKKNNESLALNKENFNINKESYFLNFPAFYYFDENQLDLFFEKFYYNSSENEFGKQIIMFIKQVILNHKSAEAVLNNLRYFKLPEITHIFDNDSHIITFFNKLNDNYYSRGSVHSDLFNYLLSDLIFHRQYLFESCFPSIKFDLIHERSLSCLIDYMIKNNSIHLFLKYANLNQDRKIQIEHSLSSIEMNNF